MKIGFISDVHANLPALEAVLKDMSARNITQIYCAGDILGYYTYPDEVVELLRRKGVHCIAGNHDRAVLVGTKGMNSIAAAAIEWTREHMSSTTYDYIRDLPNSIHRPVEEVMVAVHHGSPRHMSEYIFEEHVSDELLADRRGQAAGARTYPCALPVPVPDRARDQSWIGRSASRRRSSGFIRHTRLLGMVVQHYPGGLRSTNGHG